MSWGGELLYVPEWAHKKWVTTVHTLFYFIIIWHKRINDDEADFSDIDIVPEFPVYDLVMTSQLIVQLTWKLISNWLDICFHVSCTIICDVITKSILFTVIFTTGRVKLRYMCVCWHTEMKYMIIRLDI